MIVNVDNETITLRRSLLWVAGDNLSKIDDAPNWGADVITLDLEDTVKETDKPKARKVVSEALREANFGRTERWVRINGFHTRFAKEDIEAIVPARPDAIRLPKCRGADEVVYLDRLLGDIEQIHGIPVGTTKVVLNIENSKAVLDLREIATASRRIIGLVLSGEDYTDDLKVPRPTRGLQLAMLAGRQQVILVAKSLGINAFDAVFLDADDAEGLREETQMVKDMGMDGKNVIHPKQVPIVNKVYTPDSAAVDFSVRAIRAYDAALKSNSSKRSDGTSGALPYVDGRFIGPPVVAKAHQVVRMAKACGIAIPA